MSALAKFTLNKGERICSKKLTDRLFGGGRSHAFMAFPVKTVFMEADRESNEPQAQILVSVPKRCFKRAVKRNRVKRQIREAYRHQKSILATAMEDYPERKMVIAFIWLDVQLHPSEVVHKRIGQLLERIKEQL